jgi:hypothetical protein
MPEPFRVLSLGAGVQSSAVLLMSIAGDLPPLDAAIFADTGWEPPEVYAWLTGELIPRAEDAGLPLYVVRAYEDRDVRSRPWEMPLYIHNSSTGEPAMIRRTCTGRFKIDPIRRQIRKCIGRPTAGAVEQWFGISWDESQRVRDSDVRYIRHRYPLVDRRMTRADCAGWLARHQLTAPRSACIGCPFHTDAEWLAIKREPEQWAQAVAVDRALRDQSAPRAGALKDFEGDAYLHADRIPLEDVTLRHENQGSLFDQECNGMCGV